MQVSLSAIIYICLYTSKIYVTEPKIQKQIEIESYWNWKTMIWLVIKEKKKEMLKSCDTYTCQRHVQIYPHHTPIITPKNNCTNLPTLASCFHHYASN